MKLATAMCTAALALAPAIGLADEPENDPGQSTTFTFPLTVSPGASTCLPKARGRVIDHTFGNVENLEVIVRGLPPNTDFVLFVIQVPNAPFGLAWYNGDILTDDTGTGVINVVGRFNIGTFIVSLGAVPSPNVFPKPPAVLANPTTGGSVALESLRRNLPLPSRHIKRQGGRAGSRNAPRPSCRVRA